MFTMTYPLRCLRTPTISEYRVKVKNPHLNIRSTVRYEVPHITHYILYLSQLVKPYGTLRNLRQSFIKTFDNIDALHEYFVNHAVNFAQLFRNLALISVNCVNVGGNLTKFLQPTHWKI